MNYKHWITGFSVILLIYSGWRTFDYMTLSLQGVDKTTGIVVAIAFLFCTEVGLLLWLHIGAKHATTDAQETTAKVMVFVNFTGAILLGLADVLARNTLYKIDLGWIDPLLLLTPVVLIAANVGAAIFYHLNDEDEQTRAAERRLRHAEAQVQRDIEAEAIRQVNAQRRDLAARLAPGIAGVTVKSIENKAQPAAPLAMEPLPAPILATAPPNGSHAYNSATVATTGSLDTNPTPARTQS